MSIKGCINCTGKNMVNAAWILLKAWWAQFWGRGWESIPQKVEWLLKQKVDLRATQYDGVVFVELIVKGRSYRGVGLTIETATATAVSQIH